MSVSENLRKKIHESAGNRCGYCKMPAQYVYAPMEVDHILPVSKGGLDDEENLWLSCPRCNLAKGNQTTAIDPDTNEDVPLFNPRMQNWNEHFMWSEDSLLIRGRTPTGRATVMALNLNEQSRIAFRGLLISAGWHPPTE